MPDLPGPLVTALAGRYTIQRELGRGGMATVYLAHDVKHDRPVALKVLREELAHALGPERFLREIKVTARLDHPHILPLLDSGEAEHLLYYVMPYVEGESLRDRLDREKQLRLSDAIRIAREVAGAVGYAHGRGIVHRDIKPENILLTEGHARVADFGIARAIAEAGGEGLTETGLAVGTPVYMSPEQAGGEPQIDGRADVYSLGCVLYEMLAGTPPFSGPSVVAILARKAVESAPRISIIRHTVPSVVERAIRRALAAVPADRFATAEEFAQALAPSGPGDRPSDAWAMVDAPDNSVVVLPFLSGGPKPDDESLSDGLTEELIHVLTGTADLRVVARTSAFAFKDRHQDVRAIGERLGVRYAVEGSVRRAGDRIRITAQLVDAQDGYELWSERFDRTVDDVFAIQDEIAGAVAGTLRRLITGASPEPSAAAPPRTPPVSFPAYERYLRGRYHMSRRTRHALGQAADELRRALDEAPEFALAHAALADVFVILGIYGMAAPHDVMPRATASAERALDLHPRLAEALVVRACVTGLYARDWAGARRDFLQAIEVNPQYATAHQWYAMHCLVPVGEFDGALDALAVARRLDPLSPTVGISLAAACYYARQYGQAVAHADAVLSLDAGYGMAHYFRGLALLESGAMADAVTALERAVRGSGGTAETRAALGVARAAAGEASEARRVLTALEREARDHYVSPVLTAQLHASLGDDEPAIEALESAVDQRASDLVWVPIRPIFDRLRDDPRFRTALEALKLSGHPAR